MGGRGWEIIQRSLTLAHPTCNTVPSVDVQRVWLPQVRVLEVLACDLIDRMIHMMHDDR